jgi:hypothetical protein
LFFFVLIIVLNFAEDDDVFPFPNRGKADDSIEFDPRVLTGPSGPNTATQRNKVTESKRKNVSGDFRSSFANRGFILREKATAFVVCIFPAKVEIFDGKGARLALGLNTLNTLLVFKVLYYYAKRAFIVFRS